MAIKEVMEVGRKTTAIQWWKHGDHPKVDGSPKDVPDKCLMCGTGPFDHGVFDRGGLHQATVCPGDYIVRGPVWCNVIPRDSFAKLFPACQWVPASPDNVAFAEGAPEPKKEVVAAIAPGLLAYRWEKQGDHPMVGKPAPGWKRVGNCRHCGKPGDDHGVLYGPTLDDCVRVCPGNWIVERSTADGTRTMVVKSIEPLKREAAERSTLPQVAPPSVGKKSAHCAILGRIAELLGDAAKDENGRWVFDRLPEMVELELSNLQSMVSENVQLERATTGLRSGLKRANEDLKEAHEEKNAMQRECKVLDDQNIALRSEVKNWQVSIEEIDNHRVRLIEENIMLRKRLDAREDAVKEIQERANELDARINALNERLSPPAPEEADTWQPLSASNERVLKDILANSATPSLVTSAAMVMEFRRVRRVIEQIYAKLKDRI